MDIDAIMIQNSYEALKAIILLEQLGYGKVSDKLRDDVATGQIRIKDDYLIKHNDGNWIITTHIAGDGIDLDEFKKIAHDEIIKQDLNSHSLEYNGVCYLIYDVNKGKRYVVTDKNYADKKFNEGGCVVSEYSLYNKKT